MRKDISIFIAGSTDETREERECLKVLANDLSSEYRALGLRVNAMSYRNFDDNQERYNSFIEDEADIVFFVLKGEMGDKTQEEFMTAAKAWREKNLPEIVVFLFGPSTKDSIKTGKIYGLMEALLNRQYPVRYDTLDELRAEAKLRIDRHIQKRKKEPEDKTSVAEVVLKEAPKSQTEAAPVVSSSSRRWLMWLLGAAILILGGFIVWQNYLRQPKPLLLFAGGGSVAQYLKIVHHVEVDRYPDAIYARMGSGRSWNLLAEEVNRIIDPDSLNNLYFPISLSAAEANDSSFVQSSMKTEFTKRAVIVSYYLGEDSLAVYIQEDLFNRYIRSLESDSVNNKKELELLAQGVLSPISLSKLIYLRKKKLLCTNPQSGTLRAYQSCLSSTDSAYVENMLNKKIDSVMVFNEISNSGILQDKEYVLWGSQYYYMHALKLGRESYPNDRKYRFRVFHVMNKKGRILTKPAYIYFVAYNPGTGAKAGSRIFYKIPDEVMDFLHKLNIPQEIWNSSKWRPEEGEIEWSDNVIIPLNERPDSLK